jgi:predicted nuclease with TOPRIM domain
MNSSNNIPDQGQHINILTSKNLKIMPISSGLKGLQSIKSMQNVAKSGIPNKEDSEFIKLYMMEKERTRLKSEETKLLQRLEIIQIRLKEIQIYYDEKAGQMQTPGAKVAKVKKGDSPK